MAPFAPSSAPEFRLAELQEGLVFPVEPVGVLARDVVHEHQAAADRADFGVLEPSHELAGGVGVDVGVGVREEDDLARGPADEVVEDRRFAPVLGEVQHLDATASTAAIAVIVTGPRRQ